jgi:Heparinase II/III-like protein
MHLSRYNAIDIERALTDEAPGPAIPPASDRDHWARVRAELDQAEVDRVLGQAKELAGQPVPVLPASLYLEFARTGERDGYQEPMFRRRAMLATFAVAELLEGRGRYLDPILDVAWAICEEGSWAMPAHQSALADPTRPVVDLGAAMTALDLAELSSLFGDLADPALAPFVRHEIDRRCVTPYLERHDHWWLYDTADRPVNNWTAVCNAGVAGAAIHVETDRVRLAEILARAARSLDDYLATFAADGGSSEGPGYWSYGFGYYTLLAHLVEHRTNGQVSFLDGRFVDGDRMRAIARYPVRTQLSPRRYVPFSDCDLDVRFVRPHLAFLARRLDLPALMPLAEEQPPGGRAGDLTWALRDLVWRPEPRTDDRTPDELTPDRFAPDRFAPDRFTPDRHDWFGEMMWMIARVDPADPQGLVVAVKGGHNGEMHNQNDIGSIVVHLRGESVVADPGRGRYTKAYFGPSRYEHFVTSSSGHSVPVPAGHAQLPGRQYAATLLEHTDDTSGNDNSGDDAGDMVRLDLAGAYPVEAGLVSLVRTVRLRREPAGGWVELTDEVRFNSPSTFESVLVTLGTADVDSDSVILRGERGALRVGFDPAAVSARVETVEGADLSAGPTDVRRVVFALAESLASGLVRLRIEPLRDQAAEE